MRTFIILLLLQIASIQFPALLIHADQIAITEDGRKVLLKDDGTWEYVKEQRNQQEQTKGSIGSETGTQEESKVQPLRKFPLRPIDSWVGESFIFLPTGKDYKLLKGKEDENYKLYDVNTWFMNMPYEEYVGRIAKVIAVNRKEPLSVYSAPDWFVEFELVDSKEKLFVKANGRVIPGMGPVADIDKAREMWLNKNLWCTRKGITLLTYSVIYEKWHKTGSIQVPRYSSLKVADIVAGESNKKPVRLILRTSHDKKGYVDVDLSGTNGSNILKDVPLKGILLTEDPRGKNCSARAWSAIMESKVFIGMTDKQVKKSWGTPNDINRTITSRVISEQWVYGANQYLYFENGILTTIQQ